MAKNSMFYRKRLRSRYNYDSMIMKTLIYEPSAKELCTFLHPSKLYAWKIHEDATSALANEHFGIPHKDMTEINHERKSYLNTSARIPPIWKLLYNLAML